VSFFEELKHPNIKLIAYGTEKDERSGSVPVTNYNSSGKPKGTDSSRSNPEQCNQF
jgi:hypothetical protein